ncbi:MAG: DsbA family oxidoreductase [Parvularculaceae bacterium]
MTEKPRLLVDIVADPVCPWCYVGLRSFLKAKESLSESFDVLPRFRAYELNPDTPEAGADRVAYYDRKFPDKEQRAALVEALVASAKEAGFAFDPLRPTWLPNTLKAQRVIRWAHLEGLQEAAALALYEAYWDESADLGDAAVLAAAAGNAGMNADAVREKLDSGVDRKAVRQEAAAFRQAGVSGVPTFIVNERTGFSGALPPDRLAAALKQAAARSA